MSDSSSWSLPRTSRQYKDLVLGLRVWFVLFWGGSSALRKIYECLMRGHVPLGPVCKAVTPEELHPLHNPPVSS